MAIGRTNVGGSGGGGGFNFEVKAYAAAPTGTATENSIGIITDTPITGWVMQSEEPTGTQGLVWIGVSESSSLAFYADKNQQVKVYPSFTKQYVDGVWVNKDSSICQDGGWVTLGTALYYLYNAGDECTSVTGGWSLNYGSKESDHFHVRITGETEACAYTNNMIDVTNYKTINAEVSSPADNGLTFTVALNLRESTETNASSKATKSDTLAKGETKILSIDISSMNGEYYPVVTTKTVGGSGYDLHKVWME